MRRQVFGPRQIQFAVDARLVGCFFADFLPQRHTIDMRQACAHHGVHALGRSQGVAL